MADSGGVVNTLEHGKIGGFPVWGMGVALAGGIILFSVYRNRKAAASASDNSQSTTDQTATGTFDENAIDPATGLTYGQEAPAGYGLPSGSIGEWLGQNPQSSSYPVGLNEQGLPGPITNTQWARLAFDSLVAKGDDPTLVENALQDYLSGKTLTAAETAIKNLAEQMFGAPPEGFTSTGTNPSPTPGNAPVAPHLSVRPNSATNRSFELSWNQVTGATSYSVQYGEHGNLNNSTTFTGTSGTVGGLKSKTKYWANIRAINAAGSSGGSNEVTVTTK